MRPLRNIRRLLLPTLLLLLAAPCARAQGGRGFMHQEWTVEKGDSTPLVHILPVYVFSLFRSMSSAARPTCAATGGWSTR